MAQKYLSEFYTYRYLPLGDTRIVADPGTPLENQIQAHLLQGHRHFHAGRYLPALNAYLAAWGLLPRIVVTTFPAYVAQLQPEALLKVELLDHYAAAAAEILRLRDPRAPEVPIVPPLDPPDSLFGIMKQFGVEYDRGRQLLAAARAYLDRGQPEPAIRQIQKAMRANPNNPDLQADGAALLGAVALRQGDFETAAKHTQSALGMYRELRNVEGIVAMQRNLATVQQVNLPAGGFPRDLSNGGPAAVTLTQMLVRDYAGNWAEAGISNNNYQKPIDTYPVILENRAVPVAVNDGGRQLTEVVLQPRIQAQALDALAINIWLMPQFVTYLAHVGGFVLPLAIADTYHALGDYARAEDFYIKVRDYRYLNLSIERPMVWRKLATNYLLWGNRLYRDRDMAGARQQYEKILRLSNGGFQLTGPLYSGAFQALQAETLQFLQAADRRGFHAIEFARRAILLEAEIYLTQILNNINYLGFSEDLVPIHSWRYLQNLARYFANQAIQAERAYISFKDKSEQESFTRLALEQAVDAQAAALLVEDKRVSASLEQQRATQLNADLNELRLEHAREQRDEYNALSAEMVKLEEINGWATGPMDEAEINQSYGDVLGISPGTYDTYQITRIVARKRSELNRAYELNNMDRRIEEQEASLVAAQAQVTVAEKMVEVAVAQRELAQLRLDQAGAQLQHFDAQEFTPELWDNLAQAQQQLSRRYLDWAIGAAFLMERAFEVEYDLDVNRIRFDYERSELHGLLAADFLLADIDQFSYDRILETEKLAPSKVSISLAGQFPFSFQNEFKRTGRLDFELLLDDFDRRQPGAHLRKLKRVEVVIEGLVGAEGIYGTLTNAGVSYYRDRSGARRIRRQKPETMLLSRFDLRFDGFIFTPDEEVLALFENSGVAGGWILDLPPDRNDLHYDDITDIHLVLYYDAYFSPAVADVVRAELAARDRYENTLGLGLRFQYPDAFFGFQDSGEVSFTIDAGNLPYHHADARILDAYLLVETDGVVPAAGLLVRITGEGGLYLSDRTDANGLIFSQPAPAPLNALRDRPLSGNWTVHIPEAGNEAAFAAGFSWEAVRNLFFYVEYRYRPRGWGYAVSDAFAADPLAAFEVVDDPLAVNNVPSNWSYDGASQRIRQTSNIHAPAGAANLNKSPEKPGTYLLRRTTPQQPGVANFVLRTVVSSGDDDGIGLVFRYQDVDNFYFFAMDAQRGFRLLGKKVNGAFSLWKTAGLDPGAGYTVGQEHALTLAMSGDACCVMLDGQPVLTGHDNDLREPGQVGFYSWGNSDAHFRGFDLQQLP